jgi:hypothetical protein
LWPEDLDRLHNLWLRLSTEHEVGAKLHHRDVVGLALERLEQELDTEQRAQILAEVERIVQKHE